MTDRMNRALSNIKDHLRRYKDDGDLEYHASKCLEGVLSMLEDVELEALGDEEILTLHGCVPTDRDKQITQATISKNQSKGQLYRKRS